jgi:glycosyltransferase involved in cell wall biosynthesis
VLTDTRAHATYYSQEFGIVSDKLFTVPLGTTITVHEYALPSAEPFIIHFHGSNIPLQGIEYIWEAARLLAGSAIRFQMIGPFVVPQDVSAIVAHQTHVPFSALSGLMARAHVCLGIFGGTEKARRVIPNKVYEALASNRPVITGDTPAIREFLSDTDAVLIPPADGRALADAILRLHSDPQGCRRIADAGTARLLAVATPAIVGAHIKEICEYLTLRT